MTASKQNETKNEMAVWTPFKGSDLLPASMSMDVASDVDWDEFDDAEDDENFDGEDVKYPRLILLQGMSPVVLSGDVEGARPGLFYNEATGEVLEPPLRVMGLYHHKSRAMFPDPSKPEFKGLETCIARDGTVGTTYGECASCQHSKWVNDKKPLCSAAHNVYVMTPGGIAVLRIGGASYSKGMTEIAKVLGPSKPVRRLYQHPLVVRTKKNTKTLPNGQETTFYTMSLEFDRKVQVPREFMLAARDTKKYIREIFQSGRLLTHSDSDRDSDVSFD